jgi:cysteine synthase
MKAILKKYYIPESIRKKLLPKCDYFDQSYFFIHFKFMKIIPAYHIINKAIINKKINKNTVIIESSSGNFAYGLSVVCKYFKLKLIIIGDKNIDINLQNTIKKMGTKLIIINSSNNMNIQSLRLDELKFQIKKYKKNYFWPKQYDNSENYKSYQLIENYLDNNLNLKNFDFLVCSVGSGGNSAGFYRILRKYNKKIKLVGVDSINSVIFGQSNGIRNLRGPGSSIYPKNVKYQYFSKIFWVSDKEAFTNCYNLYKYKKFNSSPCVGAIDLVCNELKKKYPKKKILSVFPEDHKRYLSTALNMKWLKSKNLFNLKKKYTAKKVLNVKVSYKKFSYMNWNNRLFKK